ncbi:hypothetical protein L1987_69871 [Smallanthus sonchifolius]|uniref:Uncharacterized protein n=1 Tax=Smallanthus sonchifolius TaxID=185202 RepID=A0ACB9B6D3_9ASTR|nr:hypothetical protein L1987_69871 [Smallanthus sonchifolius]
MGLKYGYPVEDVITGLSIHCRGWKSVFYNPKREAFLGVAATTLDQTLVQHKRWSEGDLLILISKYSPAWYGLGKVNPGLIMGYLIYCLWSPSSVPTLYYSIVPSLCLLKGVPLFPSHREIPIVHRVIKFWKQTPDTSKASETGTLHHPPPPLHRRPPFICHNTSLLLDLFGIAFYGFRIAIEKLGACFLRLQRKEPPLSRHRDHLPPRHSVPSLVVTAIIGSKAAAGVHERSDTRDIDVLTKGDSNEQDDRALYAPGQQWLQREHIVGRAVGFLPYVGYITIIVTENPIIKYVLIGALGLLAITFKDR